LLVSKVSGASQSLLPPAVQTLTFRSTVLLLAQIRVEAVGHRRSPRCYRVTAEVPSVAKQTRGTSETRENRSAAIDDQARQRRRRLLGDTGEHRCAHRRAIVFAAARKADGAAIEMEGFPPTPLPPAGFVKPRPSFGLARLPRRRGREKGDRRAARRGHGGAGPRSRRVPGRTQCLCWVSVAVARQSRNTAPAFTNAHAASMMKMKSIAPRSTSQGAPPLRPPRRACGTLPAHCVPCATADAM
jgi:hypothetical protein